MKRLFLFFIPLSYIVSLIFILPAAHSKPWPPEFDLVEIEFNYDSNSSSYDALTLKKDNDTYVIVPEWTWNGRNKKFAYIKNQSNRRIKVKLWTDSDLVLWIGLYADISANGIGDDIVADVSFEGSHYSERATGFVDGSVPGSIGKRDFDIEWYVTSINWDPIEDLYIRGTNHTYYTVLDEPQSPMEEPWTIVLDDACSWANGKETIQNAVNQITNALYYSGFDYETDNGTPRYGDFTLFKLTQFDSELGNSYEVNCLDMAKGIVTYSNSLGCNLNLTTYGSTKYGEYSINYPLNCIDAIGNASPTNNIFSMPLIADDCRTGGFAYHAFSERTSNNNVWDATLRYDIDKDPDNVTNSNPGCGTINYEYGWELPTNEIESSYIDCLLDDWPQKYPHSPTWNRQRSFSIQ